MTANQIAYQKLLEDTRANREREGETRRTNMANEELKGQSNQEVAAHNRATESQAKSELAESIRHSKATEGINRAYNEAYISNQQSQLAESIRHNKAAEDETALHNRNTESKDLSTLQQNAAQFALNLGQKSMDRMNAQEVARITSEGRKLAADISAEASKYGTDVRAAVDREVAKLRNAIDSGKLTWQILKDVFGGIGSLLNWQSSIINRVFGGR